MDIVSLDPVTFQPRDPIENYEAAIWTERYDNSGDFEIHTGNIYALMQSLPLGSYISLMDSTVVMSVEDYAIVKKPNEAPSFKATGRCWTTVLERRGSVNTLPAATTRAAWTISAVKESDAAYKAMRVVLGDGARVQGTTTVLTAVSPAVSANDAIPEIELTLPADYANTGTLVTYEIPPGDLYAAVLGLITTNHHGIKSVRPTPTGPAEIAVEIYNGADLTTGDDAVVFDARFDQFDSATYLLSERGSKNVAYVYGVGGSESVLKTTAPEPSGLDRRVLVVDDSSDSTVNTSDIRRSRGLIELYNNNEIALFDGEISVQVASGYNTTYFLGDIIRLDGEYGLSENVRVTEFIRSADANGEKAYPAFEVVS